jgi:hypothetical protein
LTATFLLRNHKNGFGVSNGGKKEKNTQNIHLESRKEKEFINKLFSEFMLHICGPINHIELLL